MPDSDDVDWETIAAIAEQLDEVLAGLDHEAEPDQVAHIRGALDMLRAMARGDDRADGADQPEP